MRRRSACRCGAPGATPRPAIAQPAQAFASIALDPFAGRPRADTCGFGDSLGRLTALDLADDPLSTKRCQTGILVNVHPVLREKPEVSTTSASSVRTGWTTY